MSEQLASSTSPVSHFYSLNSKLLNSLFHSFVLPSQACRKLVMSPDVGFIDDESLTARIYW